MSVRIGRPAARHRNNDPGCLTSAALGAALVALLLSTITRRTTRRNT